MFVILSAMDPPFCLGLKIYAETGFKVIIYSMKNKMNGDSFLQLFCSIFNGFGSTGDVDNLILC